MATSLQILKSSVLTPVSMSQSKFLRKSDGGKVILQFRSHRRCFARKRLRVCCGVQEGDNKSNGEEPPESLFMKELRRRGMTPTSLLEDTKRTDYEPDVERNLREEDRGFSNRNAVSELDKSLSNQRERSMALNSEGLEGLIPRAKLLLTLGGTFFLAFWPLILITMAFFSALYFYFGSTFVHDGSQTPVSPPPYVDPYALLEDERITQTAPRLN